MESIRILVMNWKDLKHPQAGGAEVFTHEIASRWVKLGHDVKLICAKYEGASERERINGVDVVRTGGRYTVYIKAKKIYEKEFKNKIDILIDEINTIPFFTPRYVKEHKIALIHQLAREIWFYETPLPIAPLGYFLEPKMLKTYLNTQIATVSKSSRDSLIEVGLPEKNIHIVPEGVDHKRYKPELEKKNSSHIAYVGRLKRFKRAHDIVNAMKYVVEELREAKLTIAGRSDEKYLAYLRKLVRRLGLQDNVHVRGTLLEKEKVSLMREVQSLVYTSIREGFGLSILEGAACGTPSIVYNTPGLKDAVVDDETGIIVKDGDIELLAKAIIKVLSDKKFVRKISKNALKSASSFSWDRTANELMSVVKSSLVI
jgi:glycosyltransferase involved in cell wall biosynthesis